MIIQNDNLAEMYFQPNFSKIDRNFHDMKVVMKIIIKKIVSFQLLDISSFKAFEHF